MLNKMNTQYINHKHINSRGFTLIEVLIALLVLSIGLLGLASMQLSSIQYSNNAKQRTQATFLAYDILDRMRANPDEAQSGSYDTLLGDAIATPTGSDICVSSSNTCSTTQLAAYDLWEWKEDLAAQLTMGDGQVRLVPGILGSTVYEITIQWRRNALTDTEKATALATVFTDQIVIQTEL